MTRESDIFLDPESRTVIANQKQADLFISIHANANRSRKLSGIESFYLNFSQDPSVIETAARENATSTKNVSEMKDIIEKIVQNSKIVESKELAESIQNSLVKSLSQNYSNVKNLGVKGGPFWVLIGGEMPSVLVEISHLSNPTEEKRLNSLKYRQRVAGLLAQEKNSPDLAWIQGDSPALITKEALSSLGGATRFVSRGDVVIVKPNIGWDRTPKLAACTNPEVVKTLVELCFDAGAKTVKVIDNPCNPAKRTYARSGIASAAKEAGAKVLFPNPHRLKKMALKGEWLKEWEVYTDFVEADKIINVPIAKTHSLSKLTMGMKNWLGALGGNRNQLHQGQS
jgi:N-acetylmuramoyl-L-alanine amidase